MRNWSVTNRLADATSPYLLQHADNPVDWWPWGDEAFAEARAPRRAGAALGRLRRLPLVPRHGARVVRGRGRRPACSTTHFVADQGRPRGAAGRRRGLHGGHPGDDRPGRLADDRASSPRTASRSSAAPTSRGRTFLPAARRRRPTPGATGATRCVPPAAPTIAEAIARRRPTAARRRRCSRRRCSTRRGRGAAPASSTRRTAASAARRSSRRRWCWSSCCATTAHGPGRRALADGRRHTCEAMARGGIYDQLAGGFARYSVDARWVVPHFEKMLYDNALLLRVYTHLWRLTGDPLARAGRGRDRRRSCCDDLRTPEGGFASALDADTERRRGPDLRLDAGAARRGARRGGRRAGPPTLFGGDRRRAPSSTARSTLRLPADPDDAGPVAARCAGAGCWRPGPRGRSRPATTRWSPPGTAWRSPRWPRPAPLLRASRRRGVAAARERAADSCSSGPRRRRPAAPGLPGRRRRGRRPGCWRTTATWPRRCCALHQATGEARWLAQAGAAARRGAGPVRRRRRAASTTPPTTPSGW